MPHTRIVRAAVALVVAAGLSAPAAALAADPAPYPPIIPESELISATGMDGSGNVVVSVTEEYIRAPRGEATYGGRRVSGTVTAVTDQYGRVTYQATFDVKKLLPNKAGRYEVKFVVNGITYYKTYTVGKAVTLKSIKARKTSKGTRVTGTAIKNAVVKVVIKKGSKVVGNKKVRTDSKGRFVYDKTLPRGKYQVTVTFVANTKYFGAKKVTTSFTSTGR
jgi:uncharacterized membrane protein